MELPLQVVSTRPFGGRNDRNSPAPVRQHSNPRSRNMPHPRAALTIRGRSSPLSKRLLEETASRTTIPALRNTVKREGHAGCFLANGNSANHVLF
jgi:hypothetical protein